MTLTTTPLESIPIIADAYCNKGVALKNLNQYQQAIDAYDNAIRINPNDADAYCGKGVALQNLNQFQQAIDAYDNAIRINPNYADSLLQQRKRTSKI